MYYISMLSLSHDPLASVVLPYSHCQSFYSGIVKCPLYTHFTITPEVVGHADFFCFYDYCKFEHFCQILFFRIMYIREVYDFGCSHSLLSIVKPSYFSMLYSLDTLGK